jgi:hypothetical protein
MSAPLRRGFPYASDEGASPTVACLAPGTMMQAIEITGKRLAENEPAMALKNADNIAWYVLCTD